jgi:hypothetical protein
MGRILLAAALGAAALITAPTASADQWDYVSYLDNNGVVYPNVLDVINTGKHACHHMRNGADVGAVMETMGVELGYNISEQAFIIIGAATNMCPDQMLRVREYGYGTPT